MQRVLSDLGRVTEFDQCYQVRDVVEIKHNTLRKLHNHSVVVRQCRDSLTGFELIVYKQHMTPTTYMALFSAVALTVTAFLLYVLPHIYGAQPPPA